jgi:hypothetical protein
VDVDGGVRHESELRLARFGDHIDCASIGSSSQVGQLVQAMAGFGGSSGAANGLNIVVPNPDTSQQALLTTPQHA